MGRMEQAKQISLRNRRTQILPVNSLLDKMIAEGGSVSFDFVEKFALPVPSYTIYSILGVPLEDLPKLTNFAAIRSNGSGTATEASNANAALLSYMDSLVTARL